jgi:hypothetical protein
MRRFVAPLSRGFYKTAKWRVNMLKNKLTHFLKELPKRKLPVLCLFAVIVIFTACEAITGGELGGLPGAQLSAAKLAVNPNAIPITDQAGLAAIENDPTNDYVLENDITLTNWFPICGPDTTGVPFTGTLDGSDGKTNYTITISSFDADALGNSNYLGIFATSAASGSPDETVIQNLTVNFALEPIATSAQYVGGLVAYAEGTRFTDITVTGKFGVDDKSTAAPFDFGGVAAYAGLGVDAYGYSHATIFNGITVDAEFDIGYSNSAANVANIGAVVGDVGSSTLTNIRLTGFLNTNYYSTLAPEWGILVNKGVFPDQAVITAAPSSGLLTGGVAGYSNNSQISNVVSSMKVNATSASTATYSGGIAGYAEGTNIYTTENSGDITSNGPGYNTSAGGIAGYIVASRVSDSSASGAISATASSTAFSWSDSWQVYAGGLIGYAGGSDAGFSTVERSSASSTVYAFSPFPYAGGLIGYVYGYNDFTNPAKNGTRVSQTYATGDVRAETQPDPTGNTGDIPYAGGLAGYSSVTGSTITDSYATGSVSAETTGAYAWGGGLIGGNANDSVVTRTYATGDVKVTTGSLPPLYAPGYADAGPAAGGLAGFNYYSAATTISNSVALNGTVYGNQSAKQDVVHRVAGSLGNDAAHTGTLKNNYANVGMTVGDNWKRDIGLDKRDGANTVAPPDRSLYTGLGWDFANVWIMDGGYPILQWQ